MGTSDSDDGVKVAIRMRPVSTKEQGHGEPWEVEVEECMVKLKTSQPTSKKIVSKSSHDSSCHYYDKVFGPTATTSDVYNGACKAIVNSFVTEQLNGVVMAYGQTGSGKTFTIQGDDYDSSNHTTNNRIGIVHMIAKDICSLIGDMPERDFLIRVRYVEVYNEKIFDLLGKETPGSENSGEDLFNVPRSLSSGVLESCNEFVVTDANTLIETMIQANQRRHIGSTGMNKVSSRSHCVLRITMESRENENDSMTSSNDSISSFVGEEGDVLISELSIVDLAGSESVRHSNALGKRQKEGGYINKSLLALSRVIESLSKNSRDKIKRNNDFINYRESKLTHILKSSLCGNARIALICCVSPSELFINETLSTLRFASRAKLIKTNAKKKIVLDNRSLIKKLQRELAEAKESLREYKFMSEDSRDQLKLYDSFVIRGGKRRRRNRRNIDDDDKNSEVFLSLPPRFFSPPLSRTENKIEIKALPEEYKSDDESTLSNNGRYNNTSNHDITYLKYRKVSDITSSQTTESTYLEESKTLSSHEDQIELQEEAKLNSNDILEQSDKKYTVPSESINKKSKIFKRKSILVKICNSTLFRDFCIFGLGVIVARLPAISSNVWNRFTTVRKYDTGPIRSYKYKTE